jgi:hypothetical protein
MATIVVAGGNNDNNFAVIDFSNPSSPVNVLATPSFQGSCMVDCFGTRAVAGNFLGGQVAIFDVSNPAQPAQVGTIDTGLGGIGAISFDGTNVLVGEVNGQRVVLIDVTNPASPTVVSTFTSALGGISAIALKGNLAVASGPSDFIFVVLNYSSPSNPAQVQFVPGTGGVFFGGVITCDLDGTQAALADGGDGNIYLFDVSSGSPNLLSQFASTQVGISSISISGDVVAAAATNGVTMSLVDFSNPAAPTATDTPTNLGLGSVVKLAGNNLAAGAVFGFNVTLFSVAGTSATASGTDGTTLGSIATLGFTSFTVATPEPQIAASTASLPFGAIRVGTASSPQTVTLKNTGTAPLNISAVATSISQYAVSPSGTLPAIAPNQSATVTVTFTPTAAQSFPATLSMTTNDPAHPTVSITLSGSGGFPQIVVPGPLNFGSVAVCTPHSLNATVRNTGPIDLHLSAITTTGAGFSATPASLTVPAGGSNTIQVSLTPATVGALNGTLNFSSDDPNSPNVSVNLSAIGTSEPPPAISVTPTSINFGAVPLQYFFGVAVTVANTGPCEDLTVTLTATTLTPSIATFILTTTSDPTSLPTNNLPITDTIAATSSKSYTVVFEPTATGSASGVLTITSNDPLHPSVSVPLSGNGVTVSPAAVELILDRSGSMATAITGGTRMTALQSAVSMFSNLVVPGTGFAMGSVQFDTTEAVLTPLLNFDTTQQNAIIAGANTLFPRFLTSIGGGLQLGQTSLSASTLARKVAIVFTDGFENKPPLIATVEPGVITAGTQVYAVGLGDPAYLSVAALNQLAASSNGVFFQTTDPLVLRKQFVEILANAFQLNMAADPILNLQQGVPVSVPVNITNCESRISFVLLWEDPAAQIQFTVRAPDGTTFGSGSGANNSLVRYVQNPGYRFLQIALPPGPTRNIGPKQLGQWQMLINPVSISGGATRASTSVLVESDLVMTARLRGTIIGAPMSLEVVLTHAGSVLTNAHVKVKLTAPLNSLSALSTPIVRHRAAAADVHHIPPGLQILTKTQTRAYEARRSERFYAVKFPAPSVDGVYSAEVSATGQACGGAFERYWTASLYIGLPPGRSGNFPDTGSLPGATTS